MYTSYNYLSIWLSLFLLPLQHWILPKVLYNDAEQLYLQADKIYQAKLTEQKMAQYRQLQNGNVNENIDNYLKRKK
ncbi:hypothetical protein [Arsukibacterium sp.]|uniref:hypothetical protein n=1 Tax=Arsukibacterium sp. TaxID=1977258 RepID=UPI002FD98D9E